jgi:drug/metabolite transporter (DMT)-like permease
MKVLYAAIALLASVVVALDAVSTEAVMSEFSIHPLTVAGIPALIGGVMLLLIVFTKNPSFYKKIDKKSLIKIFASSLAGSFGLFWWFDAVTRIGASKELLLGGCTSEVLFVLILSFIFLRERLKKFEIFGSLLVLAGIFLVAYNPSVLTFVFSIGEMEAIVSSLCFAFSIVLATNVMKKLDAIVVASFYLVIEGMMLLVPIYLFQTGIPTSTRGVFGIAVLGVISAVTVLSYNTSLKKAGASLTAVVATLAGIFSIGLQFLTLYVFPSVKLIFPPSFLLAAIGSLLALAGVFLISYKNK